MRTYNRYSQLENVKQTEFDYENNLLKKSLPTRAFTNELTSIMVIFCEKVMGVTVKSVDNIRNYFSL